MADLDFCIQYKKLKSIHFPTQSAMRDYLDSEEKAWSGFLHSISSNPQLSSITYDRYGNRLLNISQSIENIKSRLSDRSDFNNSTNSHQADIAMPPPSTTIEGQLVLGLFENGNEFDATAAYIYFINKSFEITRYVDQKHYLNALRERGNMLFAGAYAAAALPATKVSGRRIAGAIRSAESQVKSIVDEARRAQEINSEHNDLLVSYRKIWKKKAKRITALIFRREKSRNARHLAWMGTINDEVARKFSEAESRLQAIDRSNRLKQRERQEDFDRLKNLFESQLRLRAPVALWAARQRIHTTKSNIALGFFVVFTIVSISASALVPLFFGNYIAESFFVEICRGSDPSVCSREFSAKGPLTISGILVAMSLMLWTIRLQYRVYLSERHLALDASEKKAFAETFLAMKEGAEVSATNEAIVLASLFRPTQDGIIQDNDSSLDLGAAAIIAKHLGRTN